MGHQEIGVVCNAGPCSDAPLAFVAFAELNQPTLVDEPSTLLSTLIQDRCTFLCAMAIKSYFIVAFLKIQT